MRGRQGFTLMEVVLVLILIGIVSIVVAPKITPMTVESGSLEEAKLQVIGRIVHARNRAMMLNGAVVPQLTFTDRGGYVYKEKKAAGEVVIAGATIASTVSPLRFDREGTCPSATITITSGVEKVMLRVEKTGYVHEVANAK